MTTFATSLVLDDALLAGIAERAEAGDRDARFFHEDFAALRDVGYYRAPVPVELGGAGLSLPEQATLHRRIAYRSASTALASGMHLFWIGAAADRVRAGDHSVEWILRAAADGEIFAAGHSEPGNDLALWGSTSRAEPTADGWAFTGRKLFTSLSPIWTIIGVHGRDDSDPDAPAIVHGFVARADPGVEIVETWDTVGLRATRSDDTVLTAAVSPADRVVAVLTPQDGSSAFLDSVSAWAVLLTSNVYLGIAQRAFDEAAAALAARPSERVGGRPRSEDPVHQVELAESVVELDAVEAHLDLAARQWAERPVADLAWNRRLLAAKHHATQVAQRVVQRSVPLVGGRALRRGSVLERLYRDVVAGALHNPPPDLVRRALGTPDFAGRAAFDR